MNTLNFNLNGKIAFVTGASRGIGRAIAVALAAAGADVAGAAQTDDGMKDTLADIAALGRRGFAFHGDLSSVTDLRAMIATIEEKFGPIDILVNNAGVNKVEPSLEVTPETWNRLMDVN